MRATVPLGGTSRVSALGKKVLGPLFSFLCPLSGTDCSRTAFLPFHGLRPTEMEVCLKNMDPGSGSRPSQLFVNAEAKSCAMN